jgi:hypothetical protein
VHSITFHLAVGAPRVIILEKKKKKHAAWMGEKSNFGDKRQWRKTTRTSVKELGL